MMFAAPPPVEGRGDDLPSMSMGEGTEKKRLRSRRCGQEGCWRRSNQTQTRRMGGDQMGKVVRVVLLSVT